MAWGTLERVAGTREHGPKQPDEAAYRVPAIRVLHVVECDDGGVLALLRSYCEAQLEAGYELHLLAPRDRLPDVKWHQWQIDRRRPTSFARAGRQLAAAVRDCDPDVVHLHSFFAGLVGRSVLPARSAGPAVVYQPHSWAYDGVDHPVGPLVIGMIERLLDQRTDQLMVNCPDELQEGREHGIATPGSAVGIPIDTEAFSPADPAARSTLRSTLTRRKHMVLCVGRIVRQKGQDRLVSAWEKDCHPDSELVLVGGGEVDAVRELASDEWGSSIRWVGHQDDVRPWLRAADVLVVPSRYEGQSVLVSEALACGLPVVACSVNGAYDAVVRAPQPAAGAVVDRDDMSALLHECRRRVLDDSLRQREARAARQRATELFATAKVNAEVEGVYRAALSRKAAVHRRSRRLARRHAVLRHATGAWLALLNDRRARP